MLIVVCFENWEKSGEQKPQYLYLCYDFKFYFFTYYLTYCFNVIVIFQPTTRSDLIDAKVVDGHVIPHHVLFTQATSDTKQFNSMAFSDNVKVIISFTTTDNEKEEISKYYMKSFNII